VSDELLALFEQVKLRNAHKYIIFSLKKLDAKNFDWQIDHRADPCADMSQNQVSVVTLFRPSCCCSRSCICRHTTTGIWPRKFCRWPSNALGNQSRMGNMVKF
jgi:hypothetical protein